MARDSAKARPATLVGTTRLRELLRPYASSGAEWFITAACSLLPASEVPALTVIVWLNGQELARWPLHAMAYGSLVSQLIKQPAGPFAIPHARDFAYDEYAEFEARLTEARRVLADLIPPYNALLYRLSYTTRAAGLSAKQVASWVSQAEQALAATQGVALRQLLRAVGPPRFATHSSQLNALLPSVEQGRRQVIAFLAHVLPPTSPAEPGEPTTPGAEYSQWDWVELQLDKRGVSAELAWEKFRYLPEVEARVAPFGSAAAGAGAPSESVAGPPAAENPVREQLLKIRRQVDTLLAILD